MRDKIIIDEATMHRFIATLDRTTSRDVSRLKRLLHQAMTSPPPVSQPRDSNRPAKHSG